MYRRPNAGCVASFAKLYEVPYQAVSSRLWNSVVIFGVAVAIFPSMSMLRLVAKYLRGFQWQMDEPRILTSRATKKTPVSKATVISTVRHNGF